MDYSRAKSSLHAMNLQSRSARAKLHWRRQALAAAPKL